MINIGNNQMISLLGGHHRMVVIHKAYCIMHTMYRDEFIEPILFSCLYKIRRLFVDLF